MCLTPVWIVISSKHPASRTLLYSGWEPVITAMVISRCVLSLCSAAVKTLSAAARLVLEPAETSSVVENSVAVTEL